MLNAFRHHGEYDSSSTANVASLAQCSTPFGITASTTSSDFRLRRAHDLRCSTPFGITASTTARPPDWQSKLKLCSTPFGITASTTRPGQLAGRSQVVLNAFRHHGEYDLFFPTPCLCLRSAQRLSASRRVRLVAGAMEDANLDVLNAFRHHGEYDHLRQPRCGRFRRGAQRLSASRRVRPFPPADPVDPAGAQRLSASRRVRRCLADCGLPASIRAQRLSASRRVRHVGASAQHPVIVGAQRLSASRRVRPARGVWCFVQDPDVLNAFRHHGEYDRVSGGRRRRHHVACSTPFGITASTTKSAGIALVDPTGAQRLSASRRVRHVGASAQHPVIVGAQRLSASRRVRPARGVWCFVQDPDVLNAFRHHGEYDRGQRWASTQTPRRVLNAFRHHGEYDQVRWNCPRRSHWCSTPFGITASTTL